MTTEADKRLPADCRLAAKCLADKDTFQTGQMILTAAADRIEALEAQLAKAEIPQIAVTTEMQERFEAWFVQNYPGPNTIIHNPHWHAPKVFRAALHCVSKDGAEQAIAEAERRGAEQMRERAAMIADRSVGNDARDAGAIDADEGYDLACDDIAKTIRALPLTEGGE